MIAGVLDPDGRRTGAEQALRRAGATDTLHAEGLWLGWTGRGPETIDGVLVLADGPRDELAAAARGVRPSLATPTGLAWVPGERRGAAVRDAAGRQPLFLCRQGPVTYFASELRELLALLDVTPAPDHEAAALWLAMEPLGRRTLFAGVAPLLPGHWLALGGEPRRYWAPQVAPVQLDREASAAHLWSALGEAVAGALVGAAAPAVRLSGGLDSSAVLAAAGGSVPAAVSTVFPGHPEADESELIAATAAHLGAPSRVFAAGSTSVLDDGEEFLRRWGVPQEFPGRGLFHGMLASAASEHDVILDGEGGDELFGCEPYLLADLVRRGRLGAAVRLARRLPGAPDRLPARAYRVIARRWVVGGLAPAALRPPVWVAPELDWFGDSLTATAREAVQARRAALDWRLRPGPRWFAHRVALIVDRPAEAGAADYLRRVAEMAGARARSPLTDPRLIEAVLSLPPEHAFDRRRDKELLRTALAGRVPDAVRLRAEKSNFNAPVIERLDPSGVLGRITDELSPFVDVDRVRRRVEDGPAVHPRGEPGWMLESWRAAMLGAWLAG